MKSNEKVCERVKLAGFEVDLNPVRAILIGFFDGIVTADCVGRRFYNVATATFQVDRGLSFPARDRTV